MTLELLATLLGGLNIIELVSFIAFLRFDRQNRKAQADIATTEAKEREMELQNKKMETIYQQANDATKEYFELQEKRKEESSRYLEELKAVRDESAKYLEEMTEMRREMIELKTLIAELKEISCVVTPCTKRVKSKKKTTKNDKDAE